MRVYYFTSSEFAVSNIALGRVKVSRFHDLNDPFELLAVDIGNLDSRAPIRAARDRLDKAKGLICFSRKWRDPLLWGHYADKHRGVCLGFEISDDSMKDVVYAKRPLKVPLDPATGVPQLTPEIVDKLQRTKFADWKYEDEVRYFVYLQDVNKYGSLYFQPFTWYFTLREVILGPRCELPISEIRSLVERCDAPVEVLKARMAFQSFNVVKDKLASRKRRNGA